MSFDNLRAAWGSVTHVRSAYAHLAWPRACKQWLRWPVLAAVHSRNALSWFERCQKPDWRELVRRQPVLPLKPLRPYMSLRWNCQQRMRVIEHTYALLLDGSPVLRNAMAQHDGQTLARSQLHSDEWIEVHLGADLRFRKEGEVVLSLRNTAQGSAMVALAMSFELNAREGWRAYVGCLQGMASRAQIQRMTKALHGLRPSALLIFVAQVVARSLGMQSLRVVGNLIQVHRSKHVIYLPRWHALRFDYDRLLQELGGQLQDDGWFKMDMIQQRRTHDEQPANKRALYARRYRLMDDIARQLATGLS